VPCGRVRARGGQGGAWTERERRPLNEGKLEVSVVFEAGHVLHLPRHLHAQTDEVWRRYGVLCPPLPCEQDRGATIIACRCARFAERSDF